MGIIAGAPTSNAKRNLGKSRKRLEIIVTQIDRVSRIVRMLDYGRSRESHRALCDIRQIVSHAMSLIAKPKRGAATCK